MSRSARTGIGLGIAAALVALAALAAANWRELRDAWRISQVRSHPDYAGLKARWGSIAGAVEGMRWPAKDRRDALPIREQMLIRHSGWPGAEEFLKALKDLTDVAERHARWDFGRREPPVEMLCRILHDDRAFRELIRLRERGTLSDGTFYRAMLTLTRHDSCFLHMMNGDGLRTGVRAFCELVDDGGPQRPHPRARNLESALEDAARSPVGRALARVWKTPVDPARELDHLREAVLLRLKRDDTVYEKDACCALELLQEGTAERWPWESRGAPASAWPADTHGFLRPPGTLPARPPLYEPVRREAERLPAELRAPFCGVAGRILRGRVLCRVESDLKETGGDYSPTLRLAAEIVLKNP